MIGSSDPSGLTSLNLGVIERIRRRVTIHVQGVDGGLGPVLRAVAELAESVMNESIEWIIWYPKLSIWR
jgi:hypothetical protein